MKKELSSIIFLFMITATIAGDEDYEGSDGVFSPNTQAQEKYDFGRKGNPNGQHKYETIAGDDVVNEGSDGVFSPNTQAQEKYDFGRKGNPNGQQKYEVVGEGSPRGQAQDRKWKEPLFFREKMLKEGVVMPMPDIRDKLPKRSFLSPSLLAKLPPFRTSNISELKVFFMVSDNSITEKMMKDTLRDCERAPAIGETRKCVRSMDEMVNFASSVLGPKVVLRKTLNVKGSGKYVMMGRVSRIHGGNVTESVTCHQEMFPYMLLYFCHYIPKVRVYQVDILDLQKIKINQAVGVCHLNTSSWSRNHPAFVELGSAPGEIEVCHWIFENDMSWTADAN